MTGTLRVNIDSNMFPTIGTPGNPKDDAKLPKDVRREYKVGYANNTGMIDTILSKYDTDFGFDKISGSLYVSSKDDFSGNFEFTDEVLRTYKFLGMDISDDFRAVIPIGSGYVIVGDMFDRDALKYYLDSHTEYHPDLKNLIDSIDEMDVRKIATAMKTGTMYSISKGVSMDINDTADYSESIVNYFKGLGEELASSNSNVGKEATLFSSIILNLVHNKESVVNAVSRGMSDLDETALAQQFFSLLTQYWGFVMDNYSRTVTALSCLDLWTYYGKRMMGERAFNERLVTKNAFELVDNITGEILEDRNISFTGVTRNLSVIGKYVELSSLSEEVKSMGSDLGKSLFSSSLSDNILDIMQSMVPEEDFDYGVDGFTGLSLEEAQAFSILDSLRYIDEDAEFSKETYDMTDPEQRGLYVRSAIKAYERNFREFKPVRSYDVTERMADLVENVGVESVKLTPIDKNDPDEYNPTDLVTATEKEMKINYDIQSMKKAFNLVRRSLEKVVKSF